MNSLYDQKILDPLINWVKANGPLGIMLHRTRRIVQPAVWRNHGNSIFAANPVDIWVAGEGWRRVWVYGEKGDRGKIEGQFVQPDKNLRRKEFFVDVASTGSSLDENAKDLIKFIKGELRGAQNLDEFFIPLNVYKKFYGEVIYPAPLSYEFTQVYQEPVHLFLEGAYALCAAIEDALSQDDELRNEGLKSLLQLASPASLILKPGFRGGQYELSFSAPSLLSALASWANADIVSNKAFLCRQCGKLDASPVTKSLYCSVSCRKLHSKQKSRTVDKARALKNAGKSDVEIAIELTRDIEEVKSWLDGATGSK